MVLIATGTQRARTARLLLAGSVASVALFAWAGCDGDDDSSSKRPDGSTSAAAVPPPTAGAEGPDPARTPQSSVKRLIYWARWGNYPGVVNAYHPRVRRAIGPSDIANTYAAQRESLRSTRTAFVATRNTERGTFVAIEFRREGATSYESYLLGRTGDGWKVLYDTYFDGAYAALVQNRTQLTTRSRDDAPSDAAVKAGQDAGSFYRSLFLTREG